MSEYDDDELAIYLEKVRGVREQAINHRVAKIKGQAAALKSKVVEVDEESIG